MLENSNANLNLVLRIAGQTLTLGEFEIDCKYLPWTISVNLDPRPTDKLLHEDNLKSIVSFYHGVQA